MRARYSIAVVLLVGTALAADPPPRRNETAQKPQPQKVRPAVTPPGTTSPAPLRLHVGDVRRYMLPGEYMAAVTTPDADGNTVIVEGTRQLAPMKSLQPVPPGIIAPFWAVMNPTQAWRIFVPDLNAAPAGPPAVIPKSDYMCLSANGDCGR